MYHQLVVLSFFIGPSSQLKKADIAYYPTPLGKGTVRELARQVQACRHFRILSYLYSKQPVTQLASESVGKQSLKKKIVIMIIINMPGFNGFRTRDLCVLSK